MKVKLKWEYDYGLDMQQKQIVIGECARTPLGDAVIRLTSDPDKLRYQQPYALRLPGSSHYYTYHATAAEARIFAEEELTNRYQKFITLCTSNT